MKKAIVQDCGPIWAVGNTCEECHQQMREVDSSYTPDSIAESPGTEGYDLYLVDCSDELAAAVEEHGGDICYEVDLSWPAMAWLPVEDIETTAATLAAAYGAEWTDEDRCIVLYRDVVGWHVSDPLGHMTDDGWAPRDDKQAEQLRAKVTK